MPQHVRGDNLGPVRQVHLGGHANGLECKGTGSVSRQRPGWWFCRSGRHAEVHSGCWAQRAAGRMDDGA